VRANLRFALSLRGLSRAERRAREEEALHRARLAPLADRPARLLSGGEQQRLALARALALRPEMLLLDEPTASLDPAATAAVERLICEAHAEGVTIVMVTHDAGQARRLGDDVIFLQDGRVAEAGPAAQVLGAPRAPAVRDWLAGRLHFSTETDT
jgi:tungstate transport system ATP-binding protein